MDTAVFPRATHRPVHLRSLFALPRGLAVTAVALEEDTVVVALESRTTRAICPLCQTTTRCSHSWYLRTLADLPCAGRRVVFQVRAHKWRCQQSSCQRRIFVERLNGLAAPWARMTQRLMRAVAHLGLATNGMGGADVARRLGMPTSASTVLRRLLRLPDPPPVRATRVGVDEWAYRRGKRYGSILVDLERRQVIDLLPDREATTVADWFAQRPEIALVTRDRSREFAHAVAQGAPQATHVLDRWHLLKNLTDALPSAIARALADLRRTHTPHSPLPSLEEHAHLDVMGAELKAVPAAVSLGDPWKAAPSAQAERRRLVRQEERRRQYTQMRALREQGLTSEEIGERLRMPARTVRHWLRSFRPDTRYRKRSSPFDPYAAYVARRWREGCHNGLQLWYELAERGYTGSSRMVYKYLRPWRQAVMAPHQGSEASSATQILPLPPESDTALSRVARYSLTQVQWFLVRDPADLTDTERKHIDWLCDQHEELARLRGLVQAFRSLVRERRADGLAVWVERCQASGIRELRRFAQHLLPEWAAVLAGLTHEESNGQVEGQVHRLKLLKRQMYGRAGFALLRKRVLYASRGRLLS